MLSSPAAGAGHHRLELRLQRPARDLLRRGGEILPWTRLAARGAGRHRRRTSTRWPRRRFPSSSRPCRCPSKTALAWFGDGSMRQTAPISPAIHLGPTAWWSSAPAACTSRRARAPQRGIPEPGADRRPRDVEHLPRRAGGGRERLQRINATPAVRRRGAGAHHAQADRDAGDRAQPAPDDLAAANIGSLLAPVRGMLRGRRVGRWRGLRRGAGELPAFESPHTRGALVTLGVADTIVRRDEVARLLRLDLILTDFGRFLALRSGGLRRLLPSDFSPPSSLPARRPVGLAVDGQPVGGELACVAVAHALDAAPAGRPSC